MDENFSCTEFLAHHGILGQKWGHRRFQNPDGSLTPEGRKRYGSNKSDGIQKSIKKKLAERKAEKEKKAEQRKELSEEEKAARAAKAKEDLKEHLRKHPEKLPKYSRELTKEDAAEIIDNINFDRRLKEVKRQEIRLGMQKIQDVSNDIGTFSNLINNTKNLYNNTADVFNALSDAGVIAGDKYLPKVGVASDLSVRRQTLFKMSPEDVLKNKDKFTNDELNAYENRKSKEEKIYKHTEEGKKKEEEKAATKKGNNKNREETFGSLIDDEKYDEAEEKFPDEYEKFIKSKQSD